MKTSYHQDMRFGVLDNDADGTKGGTQYWSEITKRVEFSLMELEQLPKSHRGLGKYIQSTLRNNDGSKKD